jgi:hypothetical protein
MHKCRERKDPQERRLLSVLGLTKGVKKTERLKAHEATTLTSHDLPLAAGYQRYQYVH